MNTQELIDELEKIKDKTLEVSMQIDLDYCIETGKLFEVQIYDNCIVIAGKEILAFAKKEG